MATTFKLEHDFKNISLDKFVAHLNDPELNRMLLDGLSFDERTLVKREENTESVKWEFHVKKSGDLPAPIKKILKADAFSWHETSRLLRKENCVYWTIEPDSKMLKFRGEGVWRLVPKGKGCKRIIEGEITVDIPLVGKMVEGFIVNELVKTYEVEPKIQEQFYKNI